MKTSLDRLYTLYCFLKKFSAKHIPYCGILSANVIVISLPIVLFSCQDVSNNMYSNERNCTVSKIFLNQHIPLVHVCQQQK